MITFEEFVGNAEFPPTPEQADVITSNHPATLVIAGAGSGKTATMANRIAWLLATEQAQPHEILGLTFTRKAAAELAERVNGKIREVTDRGLINRDKQRDVHLATKTSVADCNDVATAIHGQLDRPTMSTYNAFASQIALSYAMLIGENPQARLLNEAERYQLMFDIVSASENVEDFADDSIKTLTQAALSLASGLIDNDVTIAEMDEFLELELAAADRLLSVNMPRGFKATLGAVEQELLEVGRTKFARKDVTGTLEQRQHLLEFVGRYFEAKKHYGVIEFADQVSWATRILQKVPEVRERIQKAFPVVLLDEYQDTSVNQARFLREAFGQARSLTAVGDPNQAIYGWRGASANAFSDFIHDYQVPPEARLTLSQAFRNSTAILDAANQLTQGKLKYEGLDIPKLRPADGAKVGEVVRIHRHYADDTYRELAQRLAHELKQKVNGKFPSAAVLVRNHSFEIAVAAALDELGIPYEITGGRSSIVRPEIRAVRAILSVIDDPWRNDQMLFLLNFFGLGAQDLQSFAQWATNYAHQQKKQMIANISGHIDSEHGAEVSEQLGRPDVSLVAALLAGCPAGTLSDEGSQRVVYLAQLIKDLRFQRHQPLERLVSAAVDCLDLRIYAASRSKGGSAVQAALTSFIGMAGTYSAQEPYARLTGFLSWIDAIEEHEHGGEDDVIPDTVLGQEVVPTAGLVQVLTVNAAKGLEWDIVAIPELVEKRFDYHQRRYPFWHTKMQVFPFDMRADRAYLPAFSAHMYDGSDEPQLEKCQAWLDYGEYVKQVKAYTGNEERRLAYVAVTRPRRTLLLLTYEFASASRVSTIYQNYLEASEEQSDADMPLFFSNVFIEDLDGKFTKDPGYEEPFMSMTDFSDWAAQQDLPSTDEVTEMLATDNVEVSWPQSVERALEPHTHSYALGDIDTEIVTQSWQTTFDRLRDEHQHNDDNKVDVERDHLTASDVVALTQDPEEFRRNQRRPIPQPVSFASRRGTLVHAEIAQHYQLPLTLDIDAVAYPGQMPIDMDLDISDKREAELLQRFKTSRFADLPHLAVERGIEIELAGYPVRCVIDAVLDTSGVPGAKPVTVVDWKTGRRPAPAELASRQLQLSLYRLAWAQAHDMPLEDIDACFYYLGEDDEDNREVHAGELDQEEIESIIRQGLMRR